MNPAETTPSPKAGPDIANRMSLCYFIYWGLVSHATHFPSFGFRHEAAVNPSTSARVRAGAGAQPQPKQLRADLSHNYYTTEWLLNR